MIGPAGQAVGSYMAGTPHRNFFNCKDADNTRLIVNNFPANWGAWRAAQALVSRPEDDPLMYLNQRELWRDSETLGLNAYDNRMRHASLSGVFSRPATQAYDDQVYQTTAEWAQSVAAGVLSRRVGGG